MVLPLLCAQQVTLVTTNDMQQSHSCLVCVRCSLWEACWTCSTHLGCHVLIGVHCNEHKPLHLHPVSGLLSGLSCARRMSPTGCPFVNQTKHQTSGAPALRQPLDVTDAVHCIMQGMLHYALALEITDEL